MLKLLKTIVFVLSTIQLCASHLSGGEITYRYIGDSTNVNFHYEVTVRLFRDPAGINHSSQSAINLTIASSCYPTFIESIPIVRHKSKGASNVECLDSNFVTNARNFEIYVYQKTLILPGACIDYLFSSQICCRPGNTMNVTDHTMFRIQSSLNNFYSDFSSIQFFDDEAHFSTCTQFENDYAFSFANPENDSLHFEYTQPINVHFISPYTLNIPIIPSLGTTVQLNPANGRIKYTTNLTQYSYIGIRVNQYRYNQQLNIVQRIGYVDKEFTIITRPGCDSTALFHSLTDTHLQHDTCRTKAISIVFPKRMDGSTFSPNGEEFRLYGPDSKIIPIEGIDLILDSIPTKVNQVSLKLKDNLVLNGKYILELRNGTDMNTISSVCGFFYKELDTLSFFINNANCDNLDVSASTLLSIEVYPNPTYNELNVKIPQLNEGGEWKIELFDMSGRKVLEKRPRENIEQINISTIEDGIYIINISKNKEIKLLNKIIIRK